MNFNKQMIDLVREIRRRAPSTDKPGIKLANPDLLVDLMPMYESCSDTVTKALIKELFAVAGEDWLDRLTRDAPKSPETERAPDKVYVTKVYRGQTQLVEVPAKGPQSPSTQRIYRGQIVQS
ncbi:hypothetical protein G8770_04940 [Aestuariicella hydrocarbonica]|uniref:Uncharacterized protein n=1 Tax=Pseudomaricurvus hydrocarbonicus TaxID=1470433 RepID=A0A9E5MJC3_9GAMM|nr:hypothetical protein [Aestuariicella hydrocarbonica]NHO64884.1 hypothetical protein [Aestuariicella hydrocarbonica]